MTDNIRETQRRFSEKHPLRRIHAGMMKRCGHWHGGSTRDLLYYKLRGIEVCEMWHTYKPFEEWALRNGYKKGLQIDRIDGTKGYSPNNCRFVNRSQNMRNRSNQKVYKIHGESVQLCDIEKKFGIKWLTFRYRVNHGWTVEEAVSISPENGHKYGKAKAKKSVCPRSRQDEVQVHDKG